MLVRELMTESVVTIESGGTVQEAAAQMLRHGVGSVIVTREGTPAGIVTKSDLLYAGVASEKRFERIPLETVVSHPVVTVDPDDSVERAMSLMKENSTRHLPVTADGELLGIVTTTDVAIHHRNRSDEVAAIRREQHGVSDGKDESTGIERSNRIPQ
ncbi:CBS domain-containing protein [Halorussus halobius]|uniref:CBS domain-containing protein n=1 Tax=Halorussus halobius TaxID=1710537 RepID=UPI001091C698|nr:CBS domain-containing protein [Halorussus halobius]